MKKLIPLLLAFIFMGSIVVLPYGYLQRSVAERLKTAQDLEQSGKSKEALDEYKKFAQYLGRFKWLKSHFDDEYSAAMVGQLRLLYATGTFDKVIDLADTCIQEKISDTGAVYFWGGNALIQRGLTEPSFQDAFPWLNRAMAQFQKGLEEDTHGRWNLKYNYELVATIIAEATKGNEEKPQQILRRKEEKIEKPHAKVAG